MDAVKKAERGKNAQLAYSFSIALQNEFSMEKNIALARQFLLEHFMSRGMVINFAIYAPEKENGGIPNAHFHVLAPICPIEPNVAVSSAVSMNWTRTGTLLGTQTEILRSMLLPTLIGAVRNTGILARAMGGNVQRQV